jgi:hypothetical protein
MRCTNSLLKKAFRQPEPSKTAVFLEVDSSENGLFNRLLTEHGKSYVLGHMQLTIRPNIRCHVAPSRSLLSLSGAVRKSPSRRPVRLVQEPLPATTRWL